MRALILAAALALALAGCSSDDSDSTTTTTDGTTTTATTTGNMSMEPKSWTVDIQGNAFTPANLTIMVGDSVTWVNKDVPTPHSVKSTNGTFTSGPCPGDGCLVGPDALNRHTYTYKFEAVGSFEYFCEVHPNMTAVVNVVPHTM